MRMAERFDVIIAGAGPGGSMAANILGRAGCKTLVFERQRLPRYKPCGGAVPSGVFASLPPICSRAIERQVTRARFQLRADAQVEHPLPGHPVAMVMRDRFDSLLLSEAPVVIHDGEGVVAVEEERTHITVRTTAGHSYSADYCIGADGAFSLVARCVGLRRGHLMGSALEAEVTVPDPLLERYAETALFLFGTVRRGYAWVFPKRDHLSFGIGTVEDHSRGLRPLLFEAAQQCGLPVQRIRPRGHALPVYSRYESLQRGRVLLVGDAAGLMDPLSGEGIRHALHSARLASQAILAGTVSGYSQRVTEEIGRDLRAGWWLARLFYTSAHLSFRLGACDATVVSAMARMVSGEWSYRDLWRRLPAYLLGRLTRRR